MVGQRCPHSFSICPSGVGCPGKGWWGASAPLAGEAAASPEAVKATRALTPAPAAGVPPSRFLPAAFDRFLSVTTLRAWKPAQPHLV